LSSGGWPPTVQAVTEGSIGKSPLPAQFWQMFTSGQFVGGPRGRQATLKPRRYPPGTAVAPARCSIPRIRPRQRHRAATARPVSVRPGTSQAAATGRRWHRVQRIRPSTSATVCWRPYTPARSRMRYWRSPAQPGARQSTASAKPSRSARVVARIAARRRRGEILAAAIRAEHKTNAGSNLVVWWDLTALPALLAAKCGMARSREDRLSAASTAATSATACSTSGSRSSAPRISHQAIDSKKAPSGMLGAVDGAMLPRVSGAAGNSGPA
jgi:hypothetical protein